MRLCLGGRGAAFLAEPDRPRLRTCKSGVTLCWLLGACWPGHLESSSSPQRSLGAKPQIATPPLKHLSGIEELLGVGMYILAADVESIEKRGIIHG